MLLGAEHISLYHYVIQEFNHVFGNLSVAAGQELAKTLHDDISC